MIMAEEEAEMRKEGVDSEEKEEERKGWRKTMEGKVGERWKER